MSHSPLRRALCLGLCLLMLSSAALALEVSSGDKYCFSPGDFSQEETLTGVCLTGLPENGTLMLGTRILCAGDILTAEQLAQTVFLPVDTLADLSAKVTYLPIYGTRVDTAATMHISILGSQDDAPVASDQNLETYQNLPLEGRLSATDPEGQQLTYTVIRQGKRGTVELQEDGSFLYTPKKNKTGTDSFTFTATDPAGNVSQVGTVSIRVLKPSDKQQYTDTLETDCRFTAEWLRHTGVFAGEQVGGQLCFNPDKAVNRGEFLAMLMRVLDMEIPENIQSTGFRDDVPTWLRPYLAAALSAGLVTGEQSENGLIFRSGDPITEAEAQEMVSRILGAQTWAEDAYLPVWAGEDAPLTRSQAANVLYRASQLNANDPRK